MLRFRKGDALNPPEKGLKVFPHIVNDKGGWGAGYVLAISNKWKEPEWSYRKWFKLNINDAHGDKEFELGAVQYVKPEEDHIVVNMIAQHAYSKPGEPAIRYDALKTALDKVGRFASDFEATVHMPRIGCGLAGGTWEEVEKIINSSFALENTNVFVYDLA